MAALVMCLPFAMTACSSDDDDDEPVEVTYTWSWVVDYSTTGMTSTEKDELRKYENVLITQFGQELVGDSEQLFKQSNLKNDSYVLVTTDASNINHMSDIARDILNVWAIRPNNTAVKDAIDHLPAGVSMTIYLQKGDAKKEALGDAVVLKK